MSIHNEISYYVANNRLVELPPLMGATKRKIYVGEELFWLISSVHSNPILMTRSGTLRADLDHFSQGGLISVAQDPFKGGKAAYIKQLHPTYKEIWEIRSRNPDPGLRVFGRFADTDIFIALSCHMRKSLGGPKDRNWRDAIIDCKTKWDHLFPTYNPKSAGGQNVYPTDYISSDTFII